MAQPNVEYNQDELVPPQWLDANFFNNVLRTSEQNDNLSLISFHISPATVKGDHYTSQMFRGELIYQVNGENLEKSIIIKTVPENDALRKDIIKESRCFETEINMYVEVIPRLEAVLRTIGDDTVLKARCLYHSLSPKKVMIFEDLVPKGYSILRNRTFSLQETRCALSRLAKWHAASYKILKEEPEYFNQYCFGESFLIHWSEQESFRNGIKEFIDLLGSEPSLQKYKDYFEQYKDSLIDSIIASLREYEQKRKSDEIYVLCHGDFHERNIMINFHPESGEFENLLFIDFQTAYVGPIVFDILYSFYFLLDSDSRPDKFDELLFEYHKSFVNTLKRLKFEGTIPKLLDLKRQMQMYKHWEIFLFSLFLPIWIRFREGQVDVDLLLHSKEYQRQFYRNPTYIKELEKILQKFKHNGFLED